MAVLDEVAVGVAHADLGGHLDILAPAQAEEGPGHKARPAHGHEDATAGGNIRTGEELLDGLHIPLQHGDLAQLGQEGQHQHHGGGGEDGARDEDDPPLFPAAQGQHQGRDGHSRRQQLAPAAQDHHGQQQKCQGQGIDPDPLLGPGLHGEIRTADRHAQVEHIVRIAVGAQADTVAQGGEEIIVPLGRFAEQGVNETQEQLRQEGEDHHKGRHGHGSDVHGTGRHVDTGVLAGGGDHVCHADDHADEVGDGIHVPPGIGPQELQKDDAGQHPGGHGHGGGGQGIIFPQPEEQVEHQQGTQGGVAVDHPGAEVPVIEEGAGEDGQDQRQLPG